MVTNPTIQQRRLATLRFNQRVDSLLTEGYHVSFTATGMTSNLLFASLRHHNGNRVTLRAYVDTNRMEQRTNHILVYAGALY